MKERFFMVVIYVGMIIGFGLLMSLPIMWLWNGLLPALFDFKTITWLQAWGLSILCRLLLGGTNTSSND